MEIRILLGNAKRFCLIVEPSMTFLDVKELISERTGDAPELIQLIYKSRYIHDESKTLSEYELGNDSTIVAIVR